MCKNSPAQDSKLYYCGVYGGFKTEELSFGALYTTVVKFENNDDNEVLKDVDIHVTAFEEVPQPTLSSKDTNVSNPDIAVS